MAEYKVPQDVEAEDKLIGPFSFRQFIYLIIAALAGTLAWGLGQLFPLLAVIPIPVVLLFGALALPLRKDQPMEIYLAAIISFFLRPRRRLWEPDGIESLIEITAPKTVERQLTKDLSQAEAEQRFGYLAQLVDSRGWAIRSAGVQAPSAMNTDIYFEAQQTQDILDTDNTVSQTFDYMITQTDAQRRQETLDRIRQQAAAAATSAPIVTAIAATSTPVQASPYVVIDQPVATQPTPVAPVVAVTAPVTPAAPSANPVSAAIMNLANDSELSVETIAHEAKRIQQKESGELQDEVVISLR